MWRHESARLEVPDLTREGWERVSIDGADLAFEREGEGVIAVRAECGGPPRALEWAGRELWLGIERKDLALREREVGGWPAVELSGEAQGVQVRAVVIQREGCLVDVAHAGPPGSSGEDPLERVLGALRFEESR